MGQRAVDLLKREAELDWHRKDARYHDIRARLQLRLEERMRAIDDPIVRRN